jgi:hypothetical protein
MKITATKTLYVYQLAIHGELFSYSKGGYMLSLLELADAHGAINRKMVNSILLGSGLAQIADLLLKATTDCELLKLTDQGYVLTPYGRNSLKEKKAWAPLYTSAMAIGILADIAPGTNDYYHLHPVARLDHQDDAGKFNLLDSDNTPACILKFVNDLETKKKWNAITDDNSSSPSFDTLLLASPEGQIFWNELAVNVSLECKSSAQSNNTTWIIEKVEPLNQARTPFRNLLSKLKGGHVLTALNLDLTEQLKARGFKKNSNGAFEYTKPDIFERLAVCDLEKLEFIQTIQEEGWSFKITGRLAASTPQQALHWYFAKNFRKDTVMTLQELQSDLSTYTEKAGQKSLTSPEALRNGFKEWATSPHRAASSRRGYFLHFT